MIDGTQKIDRNVPIPLYYQLKEIILGEIKNGSYKTGDLIPTENDISEMYKLSRTTVRQTISELAQEGWVYRVKSKGTFVGKPKAPMKFKFEMESISDRIRSLGMTPSVQVKALDVQPAESIDPGIREILGLSETDKVIHTDALWLGDEVPIALAATYMSYSFCSHVMEHDLAVEPLNSVLALKDSTRLYRLERTTQAVAANPEDAKLLNLKKGAPIFLFYSAGYNTMDEPVEYSIVRFVGEKYQFKATVYPDN